MQITQPRVKVQGEEENGEWKIENLESVEVPHCLFCDSFDDVVV
jgi:hypothetical protein